MFDLAFASALAAAVPAAESGAPMRVEGVSSVVGEVGRLSLAPGRYRVTATTSGPAELIVQYQYEFTYHVPSDPDLGYTDGYPVRNTATIGDSGRGSIEILIPLDVVVAKPDGAHQNDRFSHGAAWLVIADPGARGPVTWSLTAEQIGPAVPPDEF